MLLKNLIFIAMLAGISLLSLSCGNDHHGDMHDEMMEGGHMGSGGMMGDTMGSSGKEMMGERQMQANGQNMQQPLTLAQARQRAEEYLQNTGNRSLKIGKGADLGDEYEFPLTRKSGGSRVASLLVNKSTGEVRSQR